MEVLKKYIVKSLALKATVLCVVSVLLFFIELPLAGREAVVQQVPCLILVPTLFFALSVGGSAVYRFALRKEGKMAVTFYLAANLVRFLLALAVLLVYALADGRNLLLFSLNLLAVYLAGMITSVCLYVKVEQNLNKKQ